MEREIILDKHVEEDRDNVKKIIRDSVEDDAGSGYKGTALKGLMNKGDNLYGLIRERLSENTRNNIEQVKYLEAYEAALSVFRTAALEIRKYVGVRSLEERLSALTSGEDDKGIGKEPLDEIRKLSTDIKDSKFLSNKYALYIAGEIGLSILNSEPTDTKKRMMFGQDNYCSTERDRLTGILSSMATADLEKVINEKERAGEKVSDDDIKYTFESIFTTWTRQFNWNRLKGVAEKFELQDLRLKFDKYSVKAGEFSKKNSVIKLDDKILRVPKEEVIGGGEFEEKIWKNLLVLGCYDPVIKKNPFSPPFVVFTHGEPGSGKTYIANACIYSFSVLCKKLGKPFWGFTHSTTDYASHYQNQSANRLAELGREIREFEGPVVMYVADADNIFMSRNDPSLTQEQRQTMSVYFKMFDGTMIPKIGKVLSIMDANYIDNIDDATKSRLFDQTLLMKRFDNKDDFGKLARLYLTKNKYEVGVKENEWKDIGQYLLDSGLSNRPISQVISKLRTQDLEITEENLIMTYDQNFDIQKKFLKTITKDLVLGSFEAHIESIKEMEQATIDAKIKDQEEQYKRMMESYSKVKYPKGGSE